MQKLILILVFMFALTGSSYANNFSNSELKNSLIENVSIERSVGTINDFEGLKDIKIIIVIEDESCTVTVTGSADIGIGEVEVSVTVTAETCEEAASKAAKGLVAAVKKFKVAVVTFI